MEIKINADTWKVEALDGEDKKLHPEPDAYNLGLTEYCTNTICIRKGMTASVTRSTVIHELVHAFIFSFGVHLVANEKTEEPVCDFMGSHLDEIYLTANKIMDALYGKVVK